MYTHSLYFMSGKSSYSSGISASCALFRRLTDLTNHLQASCSAITKMCVTKELKHAVCLHIDRYKKECINKPGSLLGAFIKCTQEVRSSLQYDLCHECRRYWAKHGIAEDQAKRSYVNYRQAHNHDGSLSPTFMYSMFRADDPAQKGNTGAIGKSGQAMLNSAGPSGTNNNGLEDITAALYNRPNPERRSSEASIQTQWPNPSDLRSESVQDGKPERGKGGEVIRNPVNAGEASPEGVVLLSEDDEGPPKWI